MSMNSENDNSGSSKEKLPDKEDVETELEEKSTDVIPEERRVNLKVKSTSKDLFDQYKITHKCNTNESCLKELVEKASIADNLKPQLDRAKQELDEIKIKYGEIRREYDKVQNMESYVWILDVPFSEIPVEEVQRVAQNTGAYRGAVAAYESGCNEQMVKAMFPNLEPAYLDLASKEAFVNVVFNYVKKRKSEVGVVKRDHIFVTRAETIDVADIHKTMSSPIINIYYSLWKAYRPNYKKDIEGYILECVIDSMNAQGVVLTAAMPSIGVEANSGVGQ